MNMSIVHMLGVTGFYIDTYIVALINEHIKLELEGVALTMRRFAEPPAHDERLTREVGTRYTVSKG